jgi:hypothetical protein
MNRTISNLSRHFGISLAIAAFTISMCLAPPAFAADTPSCAANPHSRQLDFWLGDWHVSAPGSAPNAASKVSLALDKCMVIENWDGGRGHVGKNVFAYSPDDNSWHALFADNKGRVHVFLKSQVSSGSAEFSSPSRGPDGQPVLNRVTIVRLGPDKVEQLWEKSTDNGATWSTEFRGEYTRSQP